MNLKGGTWKKNSFREILATTKVLKPVWILYVTYDIIRKCLYLIYVEESEFLRREYVPDRFKQKDSSNPALDLYYAAANIWTSHPTGALVVNEKKQDPLEHFWLNLPDEDETRVS